jgi:hypothetical protein
MVMIAAATMMGIFLVSFLPLSFLSVARVRTELHTTTRGNELRGLS